MNRPSPDRGPADPPPDCPLCPRLVSLREELRAEEPGWFNAPVPGFGDAAGRLLIVGLAPGKKGANRTGRPFTGDFAGGMLYGTLIEYGFATGRFEARPDDSLRLKDCLITNAVRCLPPENKPKGAEINNCRPFLIAQIEAMPRLRVIMALGKVAHDSVVRAFGLRLADYKFGHGAEHAIGGSLHLIDSYHCSRYNTQTRRLTDPMFRAVFDRIRAHLE